MRNKGDDFNICTGNEIVQIVSLRKSWIFQCFTFPSESGVTGGIYRYKQYRPAKIYQFWTGCLTVGPSFLGLAKILESLNPWLKWQLERVVIVLLLAFSRAFLA